MIERRAFLRAAGIAVLAAHVDAAAQPAPGTHRIGFLGGGSASGYARLVEALVFGLRDHGYFPGKNLTIDYRWADGQYERLPALAAELLRLKVNMIITQGTPAAHAAKRATPTIPIVMAFDDDPVGSGFVATLAHPGGNITGLSTLAPEISGKRLSF